MASSALTVANMAAVSSASSSFLGSRAQVMSAKKLAGLVALSARKASFRRAASTSPVAMFNCDCDFHRAQSGVASRRSLKPFSTNALPTETLDQTLTPGKVSPEIEEWKQEQFAANREWVKEMTVDDPNYFSTLSKGQSPEILWIGCSDSRMPANNLLNRKPGEVFVHRNIANVVVHTDINALSVMEYSIMVLKVKHVIVCGHYNCGGVLAASQKSPVGLVDNWLRNIREVRNKHIDYLESLPEAERFDKLVELNVLEQVKNVCSTSIVQQAWNRGQDLTVHGFVYDLRDGLLKEVGVEISGPEDLPQPYRLTLAPPLVGSVAPGPTSAAKAGFKNPIVQLLATLLTPIVYLFVLLKKFFQTIADDVTAKLAL